MLLTLETDRQGKGIESDIIVSFFFVFAVINGFWAFYKPKSLSFTEDIVSFTRVGYDFSLLVKDIHPLELEIMIRLTVNRI